MARPSATRWRWPPESCAGLRSEESVEAYDFRNALEPATAFAARDPSCAQSENDVLARGEVRKQRIGLEHHGNAPFGWRQVRDIPAANGNGSGIDLFEACNQSQRR